MRAGPVTRVLVVLLLLATCLAGWGQETQSEQNDTELRTQLREAYSQVTGLSEVSIDVRGGVAVLRGTVPSLEAKMQAEELALKLEDILTVDNRLTVESDVRERLSPAVSKLYEKGKAFVSYLPVLGVAIFVFVLLLSIGSLITRWNWLYSRLSKNLFVQDLLKQCAYFVFAMLGALVALEILDATALVGAVLGTAGVVGIVLGFAFRDMAENSLASVLLSLRQPFSPNDHVVIDGQEGMIVRLTSRATILLTLDGNHLRIPNASVFKASILNYTRNPERRFSFSVGIDTSEKIAPAQALAVKVLTEAPGVMKDPHPQCLAQKLGDWTVELTVFGWVNQEKNEFFKVKSEAIRRVKEAFDEAGIVMPEPIQKVRLERLEVAEKPKPAERQVADVARLADLEPEKHLEQRIVEERATSGDDLLDAQGKPE